MIATIRYQSKRDAADVAFLCAQHDCTLLLPVDYARVESDRFEADCAVCVFLEAAPSESAAIQEATKATAVLDGLAQLSTTLRETAAELDAGTIHKAHAANRLRKMARGIDGGK